LSERGNFGMHHRPTESIASRPDSKMTVGIPVPLHHRRSPTFISPASFTVKAEASADGKTYVLGFEGK